jgi:predicted nuclease of restriction endonuclease-like RecB superfamily
LKSGWEEAFAKWCDRNKTKWLYESKTFNLGETTYTPDFYLSESDTYIEIKGFWRDDAKKKFYII